MEIDREGEELLKKRLTALRNHKCKDLLEKTDII